MNIIGLTAKALEDHWNAPLSVCLSIPSEERDAELRAVQRGGSEWWYVEYKDSRGGWTECGGGFYAVDIPGAEGMEEDDDGLDGH